MNRRRKNIKERGFIRVFSLALCFCVIFTGCPDILAALPVFAAGQETALEVQDAKGGNGSSSSVSDNGQMTGEPAVNDQVTADPAEEDSQAEPVISGWHFGEEDVFPDGALFYEAGTYSLVLAGGDSETQISFEEIADILPESVTAELIYPGQDEAEHTEILSITGWNCPEYTRDEAGKLPYRGEFFFQAVFSGEENEYALKEGVGQIGIRVVFDEPELLGAVTAVPGVTSSDEEWGEQTLQEGTYTIAPGVKVTVSGRLTVNGNITINGGGTLLRSGSYPGAANSSGSSNCLFYVTGGGTLNLGNITIDGNNVEAYGPAIYQSGGIINMEGGAVIQNNKNMNTGGTGTYAGGGIYCSGTLNINGGSIRNCATNGVIGSELYAHAGGAVYLKGTCNMTAGDITGNSASNGGGIYLASTGATLRLSGGTIAGNRAAGKGEGIFYSTISASSNSSLYIGGDAKVSDIIYLDNTTGSRCPLITSELHYPITLACSSREEGKILAKGVNEGGDYYGLSGVDVSKVTMAETDLYSKLDRQNNLIYLSQTEDMEAKWQEAPGGEWKEGSFDTALANVYDGGTIKLLKDILITGQVRIQKNVTITSNDPSMPCTMTRMPSGSWGNITLAGTGARLTLTHIIYDGNREHLSGAEDAETQSLIEVGNGSGDTGAELVLGSGAVIRNGYKRNGSGVIAVYGKLEMTDGAVIENCEVSGTGGAVWVSSSGGFTMNGGVIQGCRADGGSAVSVDGTCSLKGGSITGNTDVSVRGCAVLLRNSGNGVLNVNGVAISGNENSIYNEGKTVVIAGDSVLSGKIYTTSAIRAEGNGISGLRENYIILMPDPLTTGTVVVTGSTDTAHYGLENDVLCLKASGGNLVTAFPSYTITYVKDGGTIADESNYTSYSYETGMQLPAASKAGYSFKGWYTESTFENFPVTEILPYDRGDKVYYAKWVDDIPPAAPRLKDGVMLPAGWTKEQDEIPVKVSDELGIARLWVKIDNGSYREVDHSSGTSFIYDYPAIEGSHTYVFKAEDYAGNLSDESETFTLKLDTIKPEIGAITYNYEPKTLWQWLIGKESLVITASAGDNDGGSGVTELVFTVTPDGENAREETVPIQDGAAQITVAADFKGSISLRCSDRTGNLSDSRTVGADVAQGIIIEDNPPEISFSIGRARTGEEEIYDTAPDVTVRITDDRDNAVSGGIASVSFQIGDGNPQTLNRDYSAGMVYHDSFVIPASEIPTGETTIKVEAFDHAGNRSSATQVIRVRVPHVHSYGPDWKWDEDGHWHECECGEKEEVLEHRMGAWITDEEATEETEGKKHRKCSDCGYTEQGTIPKKEPEKPAKPDEPGDGEDHGAVTVEKGEKVPDISISTSAEKLKDLVLTEAEKQQMENGKDVKVLLKIENGENTISNEDKAAIDSALMGFNVGEYLDISLYKEVDGNRSEVSEIPEKIAITIAIPEDLKNAEGVRTFGVFCVSEGKAEFSSDLDGDKDTITIETDSFVVLAIVYKDEAGNGAVSGGDGKDQNAGNGNTDSGNAGNDNGNAGSGNTDNGGADSGNTGNGSTGNGSTGNGNAGKGNTGRGTGNGKDNEPRTGGSSHVELYATLAMIAGLSYVLLYFESERKGMTEERKKELVSRLTGWAKHRGRLCKFLALAIIFLILLYYHAIGKKPLEEPVTL